MAYTNLTTMRDDFLIKTQTRLLAKDFSTATENGLIAVGAMVRAFDSVNNFDPISLTALSFIANVGDLNAYLADPSNRDSFEKILANSQAMTAVAASSTAMTAVIASSTAMNAVAASSTAMNAVAASYTAMAAVIASSTAMNAVAASSTALSAINASATAMDALYASPLVQKANYGSAATWDSETTIRNGAGLFVRLTTRAGNAGWGEGNVGNEWVDFDGTDVKYSERGANPYNHTALSASPRLPVRKFNSALKYRGYAAVEIAYIPLSS